MALPTVALIACTKGKLRRAAPAREMYTSQLFQLSLAYAEQYREQGQPPAVVYVLSAKHGLLDLDQVIEPYDASLNVMTAAERRLWGRQVADELERRHDLARTHLMFLAGKVYRQAVISSLPAFARHVTVPMRDLTGIGYQLKWLKNNLKPTNS